MGESATFSVSGELEGLTNDFETRAAAAGPWPPPPPPGAVEVHVVVFSEAQCSVVRLGGIGRDACRTTFTPPSLL